MFAPGLSWRATASASVGLATRDLQQLLRDIALPQLVVLERQLLDEALGAVGGVLHGHHARALLARLRVQQHLIDEDAQIVLEEEAEDALPVRLECALVAVGAQDLLGLRPRDLEALDLAHRQV